MTESTSQYIVEGVYVAMLLAPGTPMGTMWWADVLPSDEVPAPAGSCSEFIDTIFTDPELAELDPDILRPIQGDLQIGQ